MTKNKIAYDVLAPIVYNYLHATKLYLKSIVHKENEENISHDLNRLFLESQSLRKEKFNTETASWFEKLILAFHKFDPGSTSFRHEGADPFSKEGESWVDIRHLKKQMNWLAESFHKIKSAGSS